mgnify:CR=1 FL=1|tara:strand:+ start:643 stop:933 length:291 start_codon:yes stop_codon:yes gene_type:complete
MKQTETRWTVDGNKYNIDLHRKPTENLEQLMKGLTKKLEETSPENKETIAYFLGCRDIIDYLASGKLPGDKNREPIKTDPALQFKDKVTFVPRYLC